VVSARRGSTNNRSIYAQASLRAERASPPQGMPEKMPAVQHCLSDRFSQCRKRRYRLPFWVPQRLGAAQGGVGWSYIVLAESASVNLDWNEKGEPLHHFVQQTYHLFQTKMSASPALCAESSFPMAPCPMPELR
jgi:hypothetical protein